MTRIRIAALGMSAVLVSAGYLIAQQEQPYSNPRAENPTQSSRETVTDQTTPVQGNTANQADAAGRQAEPVQTQQRPSQAPQAIEYRDNASDGNRREVQRDNERTDNVERNNGQRENLQRDRNDRATDRANDRGKHADQQDRRNEPSADYDGPRTYRQDQGDQQFGAIPADPDQPALGVWITQGADLRVLGTAHESPAQRSGIQAGDRIISVNGQQFHSAHDLISGLGEMDIDDNVDVEFMRGGQMYAASVELGRRADVFGGDQEASQGHQSRLSGNGQSGQPYAAMRPVTGGSEVQQLQAEVHTLRQQVQQLQQEVHQLRNGGAHQAPAIHDQHDQARRSNFDRNDSRFIPPGPPAPPMDQTDRAATENDDRNPARREAAGEGNRQQNPNRASESTRTDSAVAPPERPDAGDDKSRNDARDDDAKRNDSNDDDSDSKDSDDEKSNEDT